MSDFTPAEHAPFGVVLYTDGSAKPNPGFYGSGIHGYVYQTLKEKEQPTRFNGWIVTTHGYLTKQDVENGLGTEVRVVRYLDAFTSYADIGTNNQAEINAVSLFFDAFPDIATHTERLYLLADSQYVLNGVMQYLPKWKQSGWTTTAGTLVKNRDEWLRMDRHLTRFQQDKIFELNWVKGHNDDFGNVRADYQAGMGTNLSSRGQTALKAEVHEPLRYHKSDWQLHPFLNLRHVYFNTDRDENTVGTYYQTGWSDTNHIEGKRSSDSAFAVVVLETPEASLETIIETQCALQTEFSSLVYVKLDRLKMDEVQQYLSRYGNLCLSNDGRNISLRFLDNKPVTVESSQEDLSLRSIDVLNHLERILTTLRLAVNLDVLEKTSDVDQHQLHEVTDHFYDVVEKKVRKEVVLKRQLKKDFGVGAKKTAIALSGQDWQRELPILLGDDIPSRNALKSFEDLDPRIFVITWKESQKVLRYATVIKIEGAIGIWCNYFANYVLL